MEEYVSKQQIYDILERLTAEAGSKKERALCKKIRKQVKHLFFIEKDTHEGNQEGQGTQKADNKEQDEKHEQEEQESPQPEQEITDDSKSDVPDPDESSEPEDMEIVTNSIGLWSGSEGDTFVSQAFDIDDIKDVKGMVRVYICKNPSYENGKNGRPDYLLTIYMKTARKPNTLFPKTVNGVPTRVVFCNNGHYRTLQNEPLYTKDEAVELYKKTVRTLQEEGVMGMCQTCDRIYTERDVHAMKRSGHLCKKGRKRWNDPGSNMTS